MDRLPLVIATAALVCGCNSDDRTSASVRARADSVKARPAAHVDVAAMCDRYYAPADAPAFTWPETVAAPPATTGHWRWINVWATWCKPCVEEIPHLLSWREQLGVDLVFLSADETAEVVAAFRAKHPDMPDGPRLADPETVAAWLETLGVRGASLPIHIFLDPGNHIRCVRASGIDANDLPALRALVGGGS